MALLSAHERTSIIRRIAVVEARLRELHDNSRLSTGEKLRQWQRLYDELKRLREIPFQGRISRATRATVPEPEARKVS